MNMTYRELREYLQRRMTKEQLNQHVTIHMTEIDEYYSVNEVSVSEHECNILDPGHLVLEVIETGNSSI